MKITVEIDEAMGEKIDLEARKDGHSNRNAVIRKALNLFFDNEVNADIVPSERPVVPCPFEPSNKEERK